MHKENSAQRYSFETRFKAVKGKAAPSIVIMDIEKEYEELMNILGDKAIKINPTKIKGSVFIPPILAE